MAAKSVVSKAKKASIPLKKSATIKKEVSAPISKREEVLAMAKTYIEKGGSTPSKKIAALAKEEILAIASAATKAVPPSSASKKGKPLDVGKVVKEAVSATKAKVEFDESAVHELIKAATTKFAGKVSFYLYRIN